MLTLQKKVDPKHTALIVVDVQNDFCHEEGASSRKGRDVSMVQRMVPVLLDFISSARACGVPVIFFKVSHDSWTDSHVWIERSKGSVTEEIHLCPTGGWGTELYRVEPAPGDRIITKHRYSAFYATDLDMVLRSKGIKTLLITGVSTNICVETSARDAFQMDYYVVLVDDCCATYSAEDHQATLRNISNCFGVVAKAGEVVVAWSG